MVALGLLLSAEQVLGEITKEMHSDYEQNGKSWPRDWMQKHVTDRAVLIKARTILIDRAEAITKGGAP